MLWKSLRRKKGTKDGDGWLLLVVGAKGEGEVEVNSKSKWKAKESRVLTAAGRLTEILAG